MYLQDIHRRLWQNILMKQFFLSLLFLSPASVFGFNERFVCYWSEDNKAKQILLDRRKDSDIFMVLGDLDFGPFDYDYFQIVAENKNGLTLIDDINPRGGDKWVGGLTVIILNKENKQFTITFTSVYSPYPPKVISGECLTI